MNETFDAVELERAELLVAFRQLFQKSRWPANESRRRRDPSYVMSAARFIAHMVATTAIYAALITLAWTLQVLYGRPNGVQLFSEEISELVSRVELALAYFDTVLCAYFSVHGAWRLFRGTIQ